jgi:plasmid stabilization system protein ParE
VARKLEYFEEALQEAEAAARWYAERSPTAAAAFTDEIDAAETAIVSRKHGRRSTTERADTCFAVFRSASSIESNRPESWWWL